MKTYNEKSIQILKGLEAVRKRPGMYIGSTDHRGLHHLVWEIFDNAVDEALSGYGNEITLIIKKDNSILVKDMGRGIPYKKHETGVPTLQLIFTTLHSGGKFTTGGYKTSGGLHGLGGAVVNALSVFFEVTSCRDGACYSQTFEQGGSKIGSLKKIKDSNETGTTIWFKPDPLIFSTTIFSYDTIKERIREAAFLIKGLKVILIDEKNKKQETFKYNDGLKEYVELLSENKKPIDTIKSFEGKYFVQGHNFPIEVETSFQYYNTYQETIVSFVNNIRTKDGGTHEIGLKVAFTKALNEYARKYQLLKEKDENLDGVDLREGLILVLSIKVPEDLLQFEGQTKAKLGSPEARNAVDQIVYEKLIFYLEENKKVAEHIIKKAVIAKKAREAARKAREQARQGKISSKKDFNLSGKLTPAQSKDKTKNELFLVEGESAGGSAKQGRNRFFQAILPLRGKVLNTEKAQAESILKNEEIAMVVHAIGADFGNNFDLNKINYDKVIIMTDADTDGAHIQVLLLTFFFRFMRPLIEHGHLFLANPPLYKLTRQVKGKDESVYCWNDEELNENLQKYNYKIQRFKGLGEMNFDQLWDTTMNPNTRNLIKVNIQDLNEADKKVSILMGDNVLPRREWIESNVDFENNDNFDIKQKEL